MNKDKVEKNEKPEVKTEKESPKTPAIVRIFDVGGVNASRDLKL